ncbi:hypothetical protein QQG55_31170 [Brugia pahangi]
MNSVVVWCRKGLKTLFSYIDSPSPNSLLRVVIKYGPDPDKRDRRIYVFHNALVLCKDMIISRGLLENFSGMVFKVIAT